MGTGIVEHLSRDDLKYKTVNCNEVPFDERHKRDNADAILYSSNV